MKAQLKNYNGTPTVYLDGKPSFFGCHLVGYMDPQNPTCIKSDREKSVPMPELVKKINKNDVQ